MSSLCAQAGTLKQMCTADLGSTSQRAGHRCTCSLLSVKGQPNFRDGCNFTVFMSERQRHENRHKKNCKYLQRLQDLSKNCFCIECFFFCFKKVSFFFFSSIQAAIRRRTWLRAACQSAFAAIRAGIQEKTCAAGPVPGETEGPQ